MADRISWRVVSKRMSLPAAVMLSVITFSKSVHARLCARFMVIDIEAHFHQLKKRIRSKHSIMKKYVHFYVCSGTLNNSTTPLLKVTISSCYIWWVGSENSLIKQWLWHCHKEFNFLLAWYSSVLTCTLSIFCYFIIYSYGRVYAADPYNHALTPAATYSVGAMVRL